MTHCLPACLFVKKGGTVSILEVQKIGMQGWPSYADWIDDGRESYRDHLTDLLGDQIESIRETIDDGDGGSALSTWCLDRVILQWTSYVSFVEKFYTKLVNVAKFPSDCAWRLVGRCSTPIFLSMRPYRSKVTPLGDLGIASQKATMIWAVLQCHHIMEEFLLLKFKSHSAIIKEITMFILTEQVDPDDVTQLKAEIKRLKEERNSPTKRLNTHMETFTELKRSFDNLKNKVGQLKIEQEA